MPEPFSPDHHKISAFAFSEFSPQLNRVLEGLLQISNLVGSAMLVEDILKQIVLVTSDLMDAQACSIYLLDEQNNLQLRSTIGLEEELVGHVLLGPGKGIPGWVVEHGDIMALSDARNDERYAPLPSCLEKDFKAYIAAPLRIQNEIIGIMTARKTDTYDFTHDDVLFFEMVCKNVAIVIEKARMYDQKLQAERLAGVAISLSGVAHYIKNVLLTMKGGEYLVDHGLEAGDVVRARQGWEVLKRANKKIRNLVENMLNFSRKGDLQRRATDLNGMLRDMIRSMEERARERQVELVPQLDDTVGEMQLDPEQIYDALLNLVTNAIDACPGNRPGKVWIRTQRMTDRNQVQIDVIDTGSGIAPENMDKLFTLFFSTKGKQGTGIGLASTRKIIEDHKGSIEVDSPPKQGARFRIFLPVVAQDNY